MKKLSRSHLDKANPPSFQIHGEFSEICIPLSSKVNVTGNVAGEGKQSGITSKSNTAIMGQICLENAICEKFTTCSRAH